jgi:hypothetical protein
MYWSSTEGDSASAYYFSFNGGYANYGGKDYTDGVRGVRAF